MCVIAMDQPSGVAPIQNNPGSAAFSNNAPPASAFGNGPGTGEPSNKGISPAPRENMSFNGGNSANTCKQIFNNYSTRARWLLNELFNQRGAYFPVGYDHFHIQQARVE